jgi:hypothetical protein
MLDTVLEEMRRDHARLAFVRELSGHRTVPS